MVVRRTECLPKEYSSGLLVESHYRMANRLYYLEVSGQLHAAQAAADCANQMTSATWRFLGWLFDSVGLGNRAILPIADAMTAERCKTPLHFQS
jgi:hypothetical protein